MSTISGIGTNTSISSATNFASAGSNALSPESLLLYCSSRLEAVDTNIKQYFAEQQKINKGMRDASKLIEIVRDGGWVNGQRSPEEIKVNPDLQKCHADKANEILALYRSSDSPEVRAACERAFKQISGLNIGDYGDDPAKVVTAQNIAEAVMMNQMPTVTKVERDQLVDSIKDTQSALSKNAEMNMIQLQSLVSQRQLAVQLTTQLMQSQHETTKAPIANIRA
jgi:hypothetical protein